MKNGFTLVELLAVIVILAIIIAVAVPTIGNLIDNAKTNAHIANEGMLLKAAKYYTGINNANLPQNIGETVQISVDTLISNGYISSIYDVNNAECNGYVLIRKLDDNNFDYSPHLNCTNSGLTSVELDGLVGYYRFDGNSDNYVLNNISCTNNGATLSPGIYKNSFYFNAGTNINCETPTYMTELNQHMTVSAFFKFPAVWSAERALIRKDSVFQLGFRSNTIIRNLINTTGGVTGWTSANDISYPFVANKWYHMAFTWDGSLMKTYVNGLEVKSVAVTGNLVSNVAGMIFGNLSYSGNIDEVRIYKRVLTADEINLYYKSYYNMFGPF